MPSSQESPTSTLCASGGGSILILAMICSASTALFLRIFSSSSANRYGIILGNYLTCALTGLLLLENRNLIFHARPVTYLCGLAG